MPNADRNHDWFSGFQPIVSEAGATGATGATAEEKSRKTWASDDGEVLHHPDSARATGATRGTEPVAPVAPTVSNRCNTQTTANDEQKQKMVYSVAPVAPVAPQKEKETNWNGEYEERTAIIEYDGGAPRKWAEGFAKLDCAVPPPGYSPRQWEQLIDDGGQFLDRWAAEAIGLGWSAKDAFGVHPTAPGARVDAMGLVPLIRGGEVISISQSHASIRMPDGNVLTYLRRPRCGAVVLWELAR